jgi:hypothetical protein
LRRFTWSTGKAVAHEPVVGEVLEEGLAPPLRVRGRVVRLGVLAQPVVHVQVGGHAVVQRAVVDRERDVVLDVERAVAVVGAHARETEATPLVAHVHGVLGVVDRVEADHALVNVCPGLVHGVVVEPEEALLLPVVAARRPVQVQVVDPVLGLVAALAGPELQGVVRVAVALRRGVPVVQVGQEGGVVGAEVLAVQAERVAVQLVHEPDQRRLAVLGVDHRAGEGAVEAVDGARRKGPVDARGDTAAVVERDGRQALRVDRQHLRSGEPVGVHPQGDPVDDRVGVPDLSRPDLVAVVPT